MREKEWVREREKREEEEEEEEVNNQKLPYVRTDNTFD